MHPHTPIRRRTFALALLPLLAAPPLTHAAPITLTADDAIGTSSLAAAGHWSNAAAPAPGNAYSNNAFLLRTPADANSYTFAGDSLTITSSNPTLGGDLNDSLIFKGTASATLTINNFTVDGGALRHGNNESQTLTIAGNSLTVGPSGMAVHVQGPLNVSSPLQGSGPIKIVANGSNDSRRVFELDSPNNSYTGSIELTNATQARFALGATGLLDFVIGPSGSNNKIFGSAGVATLNGTFSLDLSTASTNPGDAWQLVDTSHLTTTFSPTFSLANFTDNGNDTWSLTAPNGATYQFAESTGTLTVAPEPTTLSLLALPTLTVFRRRRRA